MPLIAAPLEDWRDPASVFATLARTAEHVFWLDAGPSADTGWSWVGAGALERRPQSVREVICASPSSHRSTASVDPWSAGPFRGGWVGWLGYDDAAARAGAPTAAGETDLTDLGPDGRERWLRVDEFVAFDHAKRRVWAISRPDRASALRELLHGDADSGSGSGPAFDHAATDTPQPATGRHSPGEYAGLIERCREAIREGDAYQLCLTTRFSTTASVDPLVAHARLRAATPAHHGGIVRSGDLALISASPEQFLSVEAGTVRTRPIKGTRPRGGDPIADAALADELQSSEKERAENVMIVDLMRNDLSRVCQPGSVGVDELLAIESYPAVHQLVSTVSGRLRPGTTVGELLDAAFPAGSMTGAPKLSAMTILHELEAGPRGVFAGCFGWIGEDGALDLAMVIRSIVTHPGGAYVGAGGGITWRSDAADEVAEVAIKARGPLAAIGAMLPPGW
jgi:para-aminobenzoate synthetase component I